MVADRLLFAFITSFSDIYILDDIMSAYRFDNVKWGRSDIYKKTMRSIEYYHRFEKIDFPNKGHMNFQSYINRLIADYYIFSFLKHKKIIKEESKKIKSNTKKPVFLIVLARIMSHVLGILRKIYYKFIKIFK